MLLESRFPLLGNPGPLLHRFLERFFPQLLTPVQPPRKENSTWAIYYGFDQYFWHPDGDPKRGIGMFFTFGASDGIVNPVKVSYSVGIGGSGIVPGRPHDASVSAGRGPTSPRTSFRCCTQLNLSLDHDDAVEMCYNAGSRPGSAPPSICRSSIRR
jgi:porin